jgi:hypothetical protein
MLDTPQRYPRVGSSSYLTPAAEANTDGSTTIYFAPTQPAASRAATGFETTLRNGQNTLLRLHSPLEPFLTKTGRPSEIELPTFGRRKQC